MTQTPRPRLLLYDVGGDINSLPKKENAANRESSAKVYEAFVDASFLFFSMLVFLVEQKKKKEFLCNFPGPLMVEKFES